VQSSINHDDKHLNFPFFSYHWCESIIIQRSSQSKARERKSEFLAVALNLNDFHFIECRLIRLLSQSQREELKREKGKEQWWCRLISYLLFIVTLNGAMMRICVYSPAGESGGGGGKSSCSSRNSRIL